MPIQIPSVVQEALLDQAVPSLQVGGALGAQLQDTDDNHV